MTNLPKRIMLLGSGELGKEVVIAAKRLGCHVIACDRYINAPAMQVADESEVFDMTDESQLKKIIKKNKPEIIIPEIEALGVNALEEIEKEGFLVIPNARATKITMNRDKIRNLAANKLGIKTAKFAYAANKKELKQASESFNFPIIIKPVMSSSGKGQSLVKESNELDKAWDKAIECSRGNSKHVIIEEFINFELEITLLTIRQKNGETIFCDPIGHIQRGGDYQTSWQPADLKIKQLNEAKSIAKLITDNLGGIGLFGVEFFITNEEVIFSELSPRPHDTGLVTLISQELSEFELHLRAILELPIPKNITSKSSSSRVILADRVINNVSFTGVDKALKDEDSKILLFGKPNAHQGRRMGVVLSKGKDIIESQKKAKVAANIIKVIERFN